MNDELVEVEKLPFSYIRDNKLFISAENGDNAANYYGGQYGNDPYINPALEEFAAKNKGYFEWMNPGEIVFIQN
jgi:hypothetical protein